MGSPMEIDVQNYDDGTDSSLRMPHDGYVSQPFDQRQSFGSWKTSGALEPWTPLLSSHMRLTVSNSGQEGITKDTMHMPRAPHILSNTSVGSSQFNIVRDIIDSTDSGPISLASTTRAPILPEHGYSGYFCSSFPVSYISMGTLSSPPSSHFPSTNRNSGSSGDCASISESSSMDTMSSCPSVYSETSLSYPETLTCPYDGCPLKFDGKHRKGTLHRHIRLKHMTGQGSVDQRRRYSCQVQGCGKCFMRQDALLKHKRQKHPELGIPPPMPRK
jgi:hypothetical protein